MIEPLLLEIVGEIPADLDIAPLSRVFQVAAAQAKELGLPAGTINLTFVDDAESQRLNREYSGNDYATDVLSFNYLETGEAIDGVIGEIAISIDTATRQAAEAEIPVEDEVALLGLHGTLHIGGYDHQDRTGKDEMQLLHRKLMDKAGVTYREFSWKD